jgi:hypothetical protein
MAGWFGVSSKKNDASPQKLNANSSQDIDGIFVE